MADILRDLKDSARRRRGSVSTTRAAEARHEEEGGKETEDVVKLIQPSPGMQLLKRCYVFGMATLKIGLAAFIFVVILNLFSVMALKTVPSERLGLFENKTSKSCLRRKEFTKTRWQLKG